MCRTHNSTMPTQGQGHSWRLQIWAFTLVSAPYPLPLEGFSSNFGQMFTSLRWCAKPITKPCQLKVRVTIEGHQFEPFVSAPYLLYTRRIFIKFWSNVWLSEMMCRTHDSICWLKVITEGHNFESLISCLLHIFLPLEGFSLNFNQMFPQWDCMQNLCFNHADSRSGS